MNTMRIIYLVVCIVVIVIAISKHYYGKRCNKEKPGRSPDAAQNPDKTDDRKKEDLQYTLDLVNSWINNCDQKSGILLAVIGVAVTVAATSDVMKFLHQHIFNPFLDYCSKQSGLEFSWSRLTVFLLLVVTLIVLAKSCFYLLRAISAKVSYEAMREKYPSLSETSFLFYGTISKMRYDDFKQGGIKFEDDLMSQIYVNSVIALKKFKNYNEGLWWFKLLLMVGVMLFVAVMIMKPS